MSRSYKAMIVMVVAALGLWGCAKGPGNGSTSAERIKALEIKVSKLEDDFRAAAAARDSLRHKLAVIEEQRDNLEKELTGIVKERDDVKKQLAARTTERDALQVQYDHFRKGLKELLGHAEAALAPPPAQPVTEAAVAATPGKS
jgi:septal ring factor EnvC (AmiA/AmiB activator)